MNYSYAMGFNDEIQSLEHEGFIVEKDKNNYKVSFANDKADRWGNFVYEHLDVDYWNEYIYSDSNTVIFIFHLSDGFKKFIVKNYDNNEVLSLCEKICNCKFKSIEGMLKDNKFYKGKLL